MGVNKADVGAVSLLTLWRVEASVEGGHRRVVVQPIAIGKDGARLPGIERRVEAVLHGEPGSPVWSFAERRAVFESAAEAALQRELRQRSVAREQGGYAAELIGCVELVPNGVA